MKNTILLLALFALAFWPILDSRGSWGPSGCATVVAQAPAKITAAYEWKKAPEGFSGFQLYKGGKMIGHYSTKTGFYREPVNGKWSAPKKAPVTPPIGKVEGGIDSLLFGLEQARIAVSEKYSASGTACTREEAAGFIVGNLQDDSRAGHITVIDRNPITRKAATEAFEQTRLAQGKAGNVRYQAYDPNAAPNRAILAPLQLDKDRQFQETGRVLLAQNAADGPDAASQAERWYGNFGPAEMVSAIRKIDPNYNPNIAPIPFAPSLPNVPWEGILLGIVALGVGFVLIHDSNK